MPVAIIVASVASAISVPTQADIVEVRTIDGEVINVLPSALKHKKSSPEQIAIKIDREIKYIDIGDIESLQVNSLDTYDATHHFLRKSGIEADVSELSDEVVHYYSTKRYKKGQSQKFLFTAALTIGTVAQPWFLAIAPLPYAQHKATLKTYDRASLMNRDEYKVYNKKFKENKKIEKEAKKAANKSA